MSRILYSICYNMRYRFMSIQNVYSRVRMRCNVFVRLYLICTNSFTSLSLSRSLVLAHVGSWHTERGGLRQIPKLHSAQTTQRQHNSLCSLCRRRRELLRCEFNLLKICARMLRRECVDSRVHASGALHKQTNSRFCFSLIFLRA